MSKSLSLPARQFTRACERIARFASNQDGLAEDDCQAVTLHAIDLLWDLEANCLEHHKHDHFEDDQLNKRAALICVGLCATEKVAEFPESL